MKKRSRFAKESEASISSPSNKSLHEYDYMSEDIQQFIPNSEIVAASSGRKKTKCDSMLAEGQISYRQVSSNELMKESLTTGLQTFLPASNKGFQILSKKFGFVEGMGLGKCEDGIKEPIAPIVEVAQNEKGAPSTSKSGLGMKEQRKQRLEFIMNFKDKMLHKFQNHLRQKHQKSKLLQDIRRGAKTLYELDLPNQDFSHPLSWQIHCETHTQLYGISPVVAASVESNDSKEESADSDEQDPTMQEMERKLQRGQQQLEFQIITTTSLTSIPTERLDEIELIETLSYTLSDLLWHLRDKHHYCFYCGVLYTSSEDLLVHCPGVLEDDH